MFVVDQLEVVNPQRTVVTSCEVVSQFGGGTRDDDVRRTAVCILVFEADDFLGPIIDTLSLDEFSISDYGIAIGVEEGGYVCCI